MNLENAIDGFSLYMKASSYSPSTVELYSIGLHHLCNFLNNPDVEDITYPDLQKFMVFLRDEYKPFRFSGDDKPLSGSSRQNYWKAIRSFFKWSIDEFGLKNRPDDRLVCPKNNPPIMLPFSEQEIHEILKATEHSREVTPSNRKKFIMKRKTAKRDVALILLLLDTGLRIGEVSRLNIADVNFDTGEVYVAPFGDSMRKTKSRTTYLGKKSKTALWRYLSTRKEVAKNEPLFLSELGKRLEGSAVRCLLSDIGKKANITDCHPHRFRHTFAIQFLRGGGDVFSLQRILGHSNLQMVSHYLALANCDTAHAHRKASPVDSLSI
jgi:integrase/recombinase XerD